jgi:hypothetical protein
MFFRYLKEFFLPTVDGTISTFNRAIAKLEKVAVKQQARAAKKIETAQRANAAATLALKERDRADKVRGKLNNLFGDGDGDGVPDTLQNKPE